VIENGNAAEVTDFAESCRKLDVGSRRTGVSRGVVMGEQDRRGAGLDQGSEDVARMKLDAGEASAGEHLVEQNPMPDVEGDRPELLDGCVREARSHVRPHFRRSREPPTAYRPPGDADAGEFQGVAKAPRLAVMNAGSDELGFGCIGKGRESAERSENAARLVDVHVERAGNEVGMGRI